MGNVIQGGVGQAPARQAAIKSGIPATVSALTVNKVCGSGLKAVMLAAQAIKAGDREVIVAGGQESMSNAPYYIYGMRGGVKLGDQTLVDGMIKDGLWCAFCDVHMGGHAEYTAKKAGVSRADAGRIRGRVAPRRRSLRSRPGSSRTKSLPCRSPAQEGTTTVRYRRKPAQGYDGRIARQAAPRVSRQRRRRRRSDGHGGERAEPQRRRRGAGRDLRGVRRAHGLPILARIDAYATGATEPQDLFFAPIRAVENLMEKRAEDRRLRSHRGQRSVRVAGDRRRRQGLDWDWDRVNVNGGAIALGHPIGASGARVLTTLLFALKDRGAQRGFATLCLGGGDAVALSVYAGELTMTTSPALPLVHLITARSSSRTLIGVFGFAAAVAAASQIAIPLPFTPVPFTLQPMLVVLAGMLLGPAAARRAWCSTSRRARPAFRCSHRSAHRASRASSVRPAAISSRIPRRPWVAGALRSSRVDVPRALARGDCGNGRDLLRRTRAAHAVDGQRHARRATRRHAVRRARLGQGVLRGA